MTYKPKVLEVLAGGTGVTTSIGPTNGSTILGGGLTTYSPTIGDGTNNFTTSTANGWYQRIGAIYYFWINVIWTSKGSAVAGTSLKVSLPIAPSGTLNFAPVIIGKNDNITAANSLAGQITGSNQFIDFVNFRSGNTSQVINVSGAGNTGNMILSGFYQ
jgi:hypothetical protein